MNTGTKIRELRMIRGMTQKQLGIAMGFTERSADIRIAQYESGKRYPKKVLLEQFATVFSVSSEILESFSTESEWSIIAFLVDAITQGLLYPCEIEDKNGKAVLALCSESETITRFIEYATNIRKKAESCKIDRNECRKLLINWLPSRK